MKINYKYIYSAAVIALSMGLSSCVGDLDVKPIDPNVHTTEKVSPNSAFNKVYATLAMTGNGGASGDSDVDGIDGGTSGFVRQLFNSQELTTDEAICAWGGDEGVNNYNFNTYDASHPMLRGLYYRLTTGISFCNNYLHEYADHDKTMAAEVRFIRALEYYYLLDGWGNVPFSTELDKQKPKRIKRADLYKWLVDELAKEVLPNLSEAKPKKSGEAGYGRVDKAAAWLLLARLYLNAEVYTGKAEWAKAAEYANMVMKSAYKLYGKENKKGQWSAYQQLFMGDNGENGASVEAIFPLLQDGLTTTSWATTLFLMASTSDGNAHLKSKNEAALGVTESWRGNRMRKQLVQKFFPNNNAPEVSAAEMPEAAKDDRAIFDAVGRKLENGDNTAAVGTFTNGYAVCKFNNFKTDGSKGHSSQFPDTDFFLMRSAEAYLIFAEAQARLNGNTATGDAAAAINALRDRANAKTKNEFTLDEICDEWSREFYFEGLRRTTLIRFNRYAGDNVNYNWDWKGGVKEGRNIDKHLNLFAIPTSDLNENKENLIQNEGY